MSRSVSEASRQQVEQFIKSFPHIGPESNEPTPSQLRSLLDLDQAKPFHFINLLKYRELAEYPEGHSLGKKKMSGKDAYAKYGEVALGQIVKRGGRIISASAVETQIVGIDAGWDAVVTMQHKNVAAFIDMASDPEYQQSLIHRDAGLLNSELFISRPIIQKPIGRVKFMLMRLLRKISGGAT